MPQLSLPERISESFTLARAQRTAEATPEGVRRGVTEALALSRQKADAAESLFDNGHPAEAVLLARTALEHALTAVEHLAPGAPEKASATDASTDAAKSLSKSPDPKPPETGPADSESAETETGSTEAESAEAESAEAPATDDEAQPATGAATPASSPAWRRVLEGRGAAADTLSAIEAVVSNARTTQPPQLDDQVTAEHASAFHRVLAARAALDREVHPSALTPAQVASKRRNRLVLLAFVLLAVLVGGYFALRRPSGTFATASASFGNDDAYAPANVMDGNADTEWLLPDRSSGWLEINVDPRRRIEAISIVNASNQPHEDRATRDYTIEVWANGELARSVEGTLPFSTARAPVRHELGVEGVERVRIVARSWHQLGAGLAEVSFE